MPLYRIEHAILMTIGQQDELAEAITTLHSTRFRTPRLFVNVEFSDVSDSTTYIGGKRRRGNHIKAHVRSGPSRSSQDWNDLVRDIQQAWDRIVGPGLPKVRRGDPDPDTSLRSIILFGDIIGGLEAGFVLPPAGGDEAWLRENWTEFEGLAEKGDEDFGDLIKEVRERGLIEGGEGSKVG